jgi:hypothetical protein
MTAGLSPLEVMELGRPGVHPCPSEKTVQGTIVRVAKAVGFRVYSTSQYRASHVAVGMPDLKLFHPPLNLGLWWETKTYGKREWNRGEMRLKPLDPDQATFREYCAACRELYGWGALPEFYDMLLGRGLATRAGGTGQIILNQRGPAARRST